LQNLKIQIEQHAEDKENLQIELDANMSYIEQLESLSKITGKKANTKMQI
jgi:hypothetical protein